MHEGKRRLSSLREEAIAHRVAIKHRTLFYIYDWPPPRGGERGGGVKVGVGFFPTI